MSCYIAKSFFNELRTNDLLPTLHHSNVGFATAILAPPLAASGRGRLRTLAALGRIPQTKDGNRLDRGRNAPIVTTIICTRRRCPSNRKI